MFSALTGSLVSYYAHSWLWGLLAALAIGVLMSLMMGFFAFQLKTDITLCRHRHQHDGLRRYTVLMQGHYESD